MIFIVSVCIHFHLSDPLRVSDPLLTVGLTSPFCCLNQIHAGQITHLC